MVRKLRLLLFFNIIVILSSIALANSLQLNYTTVSQAKSNWCWVASAENSVRAFSTSIINQNSTVHYLKGTPSDPYPNVTGSLLDTKNAADYMNYHVKTYSYTPISLTNGVKAYSYLCSLINSNYPPVLSAGYYNTAGVRNGGHCVTMVGYDYNTVNKLTYVDPHDNVRYTCTYAAFKSGSYNGRKYDGTVWTH